jgi:hypothetical protein
MRTKPLLANRCLPSIARCVLFVIPLVLCASCGSKKQSTDFSANTWSGTIVYSSCNADEAFAESPECFRVAPGASLSLYDDTNRVMYGLEPQQKVTFQPGDSVSVQGVLRDENIEIQSIAPMSIGLAVGEKAPPFSLPDQFGHIQTLDTLKKPAGTVLLFFRSADW